MLPRNSNIGNKKIGHRKLFFALSIFLFCLGSIPQANAENVLVKFYQEHISVVDGNRCQMVPSCSSYASKAIEKHGPVLGWVMAMDRLVRCGRDETKVSMQVHVKGREYTYDPVSANDFWWFENKKK